MRSKIIVRTLFIFSVILSGCKADGIKINKYGIFEVSFTASGNYSNPFTEVNAWAEFVTPGGFLRKIPLFWDGGKTFKLRISPDTEGTWSYTVRSNDKRLDRQKGTFICVKSNLRGTIRPMEEFPHHFQFSNGERMWFMGETAWALFNDNEKEKLDRSAFEHYIKKRASQSFNAVNAIILSFVF